MNAKIIAIIAGIVVVGGGIYVVTTQSPQAGPTVTEQSSTQTIDSFAELVQRGQPVTCTFTHDDGTNRTDGTVYMTDGAERIRGDFTLQQTGVEPMEGQMIRKDGYNYVWGSFYEQGIKMAVTESNQEQLFGDDQKNAAVDEDTEFTCTTWRVDNSMFDLPTDVEFVDTAAYMDTQMEAMREVQGVDCSVCDQAPAGTPRTQCLQALGCS